MHTYRAQKEACNNVTVVLQYQFTNKKHILLSARAASIIFKINTTEESSTKLIPFKKIHIVCTENPRKDLYIDVYERENFF